MKYVVTGASGFVGKYLVQVLADHNHQVTGIVRRRGALAGLPATEIIADLFDLEQTAAVITAVAPDGIFHLAAAETSPGQSWNHPEQTISDNIATTMSVLGAARRQTKSPRILLASSAEAIGPIPERDQPIAETVVCQPVSPYGVSKLMCEQLATCYHRQFDVPLVVARAFTHIGPGQRDTFVVASFAKQIAALEKAGGGGLLVGNLTAQRDFTDVRDVVRAYERLMERGENGMTYHIGTKTAHQISEVVNFLRGQATATIKITEDPSRLRPNDQPIQIADPTRINQLGWQPTISFEQTLRDMLAAARQNNQGEP